MQKISTHQQSGYYDKYWNEMESDFFKLETLQIYNSDTKWNAYIKFQSGDFFSAKEIIKKDLKSIKKDYQKVTKKCIPLNRIHIVDLPISKYLKFEFEYYKIANEILKENFFIITTEEVEKLNFKMPLNDFIMFDKSKVIVNIFNSKNDFIYSKITDVTAEVKDFVFLKKSLIEKATPLKDFIF